MQIGFYFRFYLSCHITLCSLYSPRKYVGVMGARERLLQLLQLETGEGGTIASLLALRRILISLAVAVGIRYGTVGAAAGATRH